VHHHEDWQAFQGSEHRPDRLWLLTTQSQQAYWSVRYEAGDGLVFGNEGSGVPDWLHTELMPQRLTIPHPNGAMRSLNLSTAAGIVCYEALRQQALS
jgi:tRNA (cytidine/uridine-2'-O-)-methyltransferase